MDLSNIVSVAATIIASLGGSGIIIFSLSNWLGKVWAERLMQSEKMKFAKEIDEIRHRFSIEQNKLFIIHENQKDSFRRVIKGMYDCTRYLAQEPDVAWEPTDNKKSEKLSEILLQEALFIGADCEHALRIFQMVLQSTIYHYDFNPDPGDRKLRQSYEQLNFISERIIEYFRLRIGISEEVDPLKDVFMIGACLILNRYHFREAGLPTEGIFKIELNQGPSELVSIAKENKNQLEQEILNFINYLEGDSIDNRAFFETISDAKYYLKRVA